MSSESTCDALFTVGRRQRERQRRSLRRHWLERGWAIPASSGAAARSTTPEPPDAATDQPSAVVAARPKQAA